MYTLNLPEVTLQFFLLKQSRYNRPHEDFIGDGPNHKVAKDTHRTNPAGATKQSNFIYITTKGIQNALHEVLKQREKVIE